jgi:hypothetical protein
MKPEFNVKLANFKILEDLIIGKKSLDSIVDN